MERNKEEKDKVVENGRIKGTSAFNIKQTNDADEISWSNNKYESTYTNENTKSEDKN